MAEMKYPTPIHVEIAADDTQRAKTFYSALFGWKIEKIPGPMEYWGIDITGQGMESRPPLTGGLKKRTVPQEGILNYIVVPSVKDYAAKIQNLGGTIVVPTTAIPATGYFAICQDTEKNVFGLWENNNQAR